MRMSTFLRGIVPAVLFALPFAAAAQGELVVYCTVQEEWCRPMVAAFEKKTGIKVLMTRKSAGEFYAQIKAEAANPRGDIWWGGTGDPHLQAAEEGLTEPYKSPKLASCRIGRCARPRQSKFRTVGDLRRRARLQLQHRAAQEKEHCPSRSAGPTSSSRSSRTRCRSPTRIRPARRTRCSRRWCRSWARTRRSTT